MIVCERSPSTIGSGQPTLSTVTVRLVRSGGHCSVPAIHGAARRPICSGQGISSVVDK
ncbi:MAG: hypothetical protein Q8L55_06920 [Phycisphaerales bacterium]|nr:hypothetical protein [Phycisphaerales bacterium]